MEAEMGDKLAEFNGASPFLLKQFEAGLSLAEFQRAVAHASFEPVLVPTLGAYPLSVGRLGLTGLSKPSFAIASEQHFALAIESHAADTLRQNLKSSLERVALARETALGELHQALDQAGKASRRRRRRLHPRLRLWACWAVIVQCK